MGIVEIQRAGTGASVRQAQSARPRRKLLTARGTTLVELLAAVVVLILFSLMINTGLNLALRSYRAMVSEAETQTLLSTAADTLINELRFARDVQTDEASGEVTFYRSRTFGYNASIILQNGQLYVQQLGGGAPQPLLASGAYGTGGIYKINLPGKITYEKDDKVFTFTIEILDGEEKKKEQEFQVRCLNGT